MKSWVLKVHPIEATSVHFVRERLFPQKVSASEEQNATILHEFSDSLNTHDLHALVRGDEGIKYTIIKRDPFKEKSKTLQTLAKDNLRAQSDFVFLQCQSRGLE